MQFIEVFLYKRVYVNYTLILGARQNWQFLYAKIKILWNNFPQIP